MNKNDFSCHCGHNIVHHHLLMELLSAHIDQHLRGKKGGILPVQNPDVYSVLPRTTDLTTFVSPLFPFIIEGAHYPPLSSQEPNDSARVQDPGPTSICTEMSVRAGASLKSLSYLCL